MEGITLYPISYYEKTTFKGSYRGINFYLQKSGEENPVLLATVWKGPFAFDYTEEEKYSQEFPYNEEGILAADNWIADKQRALCGG